MYTARVSFADNIKNIPSTSSIPGWNLLIAFGHRNPPVDLVVLDLKILWHSPSISIIISFFLSLTLQAAARIIALVLKVGFFLAYKNKPITSFVKVLVKNLPNIF
jgi:hypothetical protein